MATRNNWYNNENENEQEEEQDQNHPFCETEIFVSEFENKDLTETFVPWVAADGSQVILLCSTNTNSCTSNTDTDTDTDTYDQDPIAIDEDENKLSFNADYADDDDVESERERADEIQYCDSNSNSDSDGNTNTHHMLNIADADDGDDVDIDIDIDNSTSTDTDVDYNLDFISQIETKENLYMDLQTINENIDDADATTTVSNLGGNYNSNCNNSNSNSTTSIIVEQNEVLDMTLFLKDSDIPSVSLSAPVSESRSRSQSPSPSPSHSHTYTNQNVNTHFEQNEQEQQYIHESDQSTSTSAISIVEINSNTKFFCRFRSISESRCIKSINTVQSLKRHYSRCHNFGLCYYCAKTFPFEQQESHSILCNWYSKDQEYAPEFRRNVKCEQCTFVSDRGADSLKAHMRQIHGHYVNEQHKHFTCRLIKSDKVRCREKFKTLRYLRTHYQDQHGVYFCHFPQCGKFIPLVEKHKHKLDIHKSKGMTKYLF